MKKTHLKYICFLFSFYTTFCFSQQKTKIETVYDTINKSFEVKQEIIFKNNSKKPISKIIVNDWTNAYSDKFSPLGKKFSDEFVRSFHYAFDSERGKTTILSINENVNDLKWNRIENQIDLIEINFDKEIQPQESIRFQANYQLKLPDSKFTGYGYKNKNIYFNNTFLSIAKCSEDGVFYSYSNKNLEDIANYLYEEINLKIVIPKNFSISSNLPEINTTEQNNQKTIQFSSKNDNEIQLAIEKKSSFEIFDIDDMKIETNLTSNKISTIDRAIIIDKIIKFTNQNLGIISKNKILVTQADYDRNPFYGLNQLPSFLSPFRDDFIFEIKFLKAYLQNYLKSTLKIDFRKDGYILDCFQSYFMIKYIEENYPDQKLIGGLSRFKIIKGYKLANTLFNEQYNFVQLFMARKNLDQPIGNPKDSFIKFNEQISNKDKAGAVLYFLRDYIGAKELEKGLLEFFQMNITNQTTSLDFETILTKNTTKNIDWVFPNFIHSNNLIDYKFGKINKTIETVEVEIKNNSTNQAYSPVKIVGKKNENTVFEKWLNTVKKDTTLVFQKNEIDKIIINENNSLPEINTRNNYYSFRKILNKPIKFNFLTDLEDTRYNQIFYTPELGYNLYDGFLFSLTLANKSLIEKPVRVFVSPTYSSQTQQIVGNFGGSYNQIFRNQKLYGIQYGLGGSRYHYVYDAAYLKFIPYLLFKFRNTNLVSNERQFVSLSGNILNREKTKYTTTSDRLFSSEISANYSYSNYQMNKGFSFGVGTSISNDFGKIVSTINYSKLFQNNYQLSLRLFNGYFIYNTYNGFGLDTPKDVFFDQNLYGRSESTGFFSQQVVISEGGFKSKLSNPYGDKWMSSLNVNSSLWHWIQLYGDVALYQNSSKNIQFAYDSGIHFNILPGYFELFFPVYSSNGLEVTQNNYHQKIRFVITLSPNTLIQLFTRKWF
ncbi:MAG: hypothetical protein QM535_13165 [Limnohabitans sp.]|nr:hypothetical protein [Limnohabitans sp.]